MSEDFLLSASSAARMTAAVSQLQSLSGVEVLRSIGNHNSIVRVADMAVQEFRKIANSLDVLLNPLDDPAEWFISAPSEEQLTAAIQSFQELGIELIRTVGDRLGDRHCTIRATPALLLAILAQVPNASLSITPSGLSSEWLISSPTSSQLETAIQQFNALNIELIHNIGNRRSEVRATPGAMEHLLTSASESNLLLASTGFVEPL